MATVTSIADAIKTLLLALDEVDQASTESFLPAVTTTKAAVIMAPFGQRDAFTFADVSGANFAAVQRIPAQIWVKHTNGQEATVADRAREVGLNAAKTLMANDGSGYMLAPDEAITAEVEEFMIDVGGIPYLLVRLSIPVLNEGAVS